MLDVQNTGDSPSSRRAVRRDLRPINTSWDADRVYRQMVLLVTFSDSCFMFDDPKDYYDRMFNENGFNRRNGKGCVAEYFRDQSAGQFNLQFDIFGPYQVSSKAQPIENPTADTHNYARDTWAEALGLVAKDSPDTDFSVYDWDGDGYVEQVIIVHAGPSGNTGISAYYGHTWPFTSTISDVELPGGVIADYISVTGERFYGTLDQGFGTVCHEFSHALGLPDVYPTSGDTGYFSVVDEWDLMDGGNFTNKGWCPPNFSPLEKMLMGWLEPVRLTEPTTVKDMKPVADGGVVYQISHTRSEYYLLENRQQTGWDAGVPGKGLVIWHVYYNRNLWKYNAVNNDADQFRYDLIHADNRDYNDWISIITENYQNSSMMNSYILSGTPYPYIDSDVFNNQLTDTSVPAAEMYQAKGDDSTLLGKSITDIQLSDDGLVSFQFMGLPTGWDEAEAVRTRQQADDGCYVDLQGRRMTEKPTAKGIYIFGGKKIIVY